MVAVTPSSKLSSAAVDVMAVPPKPILNKFVKSFTVAPDPPPSAYIIFAEPLGISTFLVPSVVPVP